MNSLSCSVGADKVQETKTAGDGRTEHRKGQSREKRKLPEALHVDLNTGQRTQVGKLYKAGERTPTVIREVAVTLNCPLKSEAIMGDARLSTDDKSPDLIPGLKKKKKKSILRSCVSCSKWSKCCRHVGRGSIPSQSTTLRRLSSQGNLGCQFTLKGLQRHGKNNLLRMPPFFVSLEDLRKGVD